MAWAPLNDDPEILKRRSRGKVYAAVRRGELVRPAECSNCHATGRRIQAHHEDYWKPLEVTWLCQRCHGRRHRSGLRVFKDAFRMFRMLTGRIPFDD